MGQVTSDILENQLRALDEDCSVSVADTEQSSGLISWDIKTHSKSFSIISKPDCSKQEGWGRYKIDIGIIPNNRSFLFEEKNEPKQDSDFDFFELSVNQLLLILSVLIAQVILVLIVFVLK